MRRPKQEINDVDEIATLLEKAQICQIALNTSAPTAGISGVTNKPADQGAATAPYIVALNYGYDFLPTTRSLRLWFHCALEGRKLDLLRANPACGFQLVAAAAVSWPEGFAAAPDSAPAPSDKPATACDSSEIYESLVGAGILREVSTADERLHGFQRLMEHYGGGALPFKPDVMARTLVLCLDVEYFTGKRSN